MGAPSLENLTTVPGASRDPRVNPKPGDVLSRWGTPMGITRVDQGCVFTVPVLDSQRGWVGILAFRAWAKTADVTRNADDYAPEVAVAQLSGESF